MVYFYWYSQGGLAILELDLEDPEQDPAKP